MVTIRDQHFGVEIEVTGTTRHNIAEAVAQAVGGRITATHRPGYNATVVTDTQGREWQIKNDSSIEAVNGHQGSEVVTPVLTYNDIPLLQDVARKVRAAGAVASRSCAIHIHVSAEAHTPQTLANLAKMYYKNEDLIFDALQVYPERRQRYCRPMAAASGASRRNTFEASFNRQVHIQEAGNMETKEATKHELVNEDTVFIGTAVEIIQQMRDQAYFERGVNIEVYLDHLSSLIRRVAGVDIKPVGDNIESQAESFVKGLIDAGYFKEA